MDGLGITRLIAAAGLIVSLVGILLRLRDIMNRPWKKDYSRERGKPRRGVLYAFTLGMAPWEKESTRLHWVAYIRGILFHVGIFAALAALPASLWLDRFPVWLKWGWAALMAAGSLLGFAGIYIRLAGPNERAISLPDDYFSVFLTSLFIGLGALGLIWPASLPVFYIVGGLLLAYVPVSKIRHCVYFFYSKFFFGHLFGRRGVIGQAKSEYAE